ncbi:MAG: HAD family hydrolase [archaeon]
MTIKALLFDFWGTIVENGVFPSPIRQVRRALRNEEDFSDFVQRFEKEFMLKTYQDLYEAFTAVCQAFSIEPDKELLDYLVGLWNRNKLFAKPYIETKPVLEGLKANFQLVLVANSDCFSVSEVMEKYGLNETFDHVLLSHEVGHLKTDPQMWDIVLEKTGCEKEEVMMVGDSIESDMAPASNAGMSAVLVDRRDRREYPDKVRNLKELSNYLSTMQTQ